MFWWWGSGWGWVGGLISTAVLIAVIVVAVLLLRQELPHLERRFGEPYRAYAAQVPRFLPKFALWKPVGMIEIQSAVVTRTFVESCFFLAAIPLAEGIEMLQNAGILPTWFLLP